MQFSWFSTAMITAENATADAAGRKTDVFIKGVKDGAQ